MIFCNRWYYGLWGGKMWSLWCYSCIYKSVELVDQTLTLQLILIFINWLIFNVMCPFIINLSWNTIYCICWYNAWSIKLSNVLILWMSMFTESLLLYCVKLIICLLSETYEERNWRTTKLRSTLWLYHSSFLLTFIEK